MTLPIIGRDDSFPALCARVRAAIVRRMGANAAKEFLLLLDLIEMLDIDKQDRIKDAKETIRG